MGRNVYNYVTAQMLAAVMLEPEELCVGTLLGNAYTVQI